jgi:hypothetical protein
MVNLAPGETIDVEYEAVNVGDVDSTQTLELTLDDGTVTTVDTSIEETFTVGSSTTGTLTWDVPTDQSTGTYQLCVESENSTDCIQVDIQ